jgi:hypothetical protein
VKEIENEQNSEERVCGGSAEVSCSYREASSTEKLWTL